jgi:precorrin-3B synthase
MSRAPEVKGWCPGALRPMMSADGLVVRVRPWRGRLSAAQALGLCDAAERFGSGQIDLTNRANLQLRGISEAAHGELLAALDALGLLDTDPAIEWRRNILLAPFWSEGDVGPRLHDALVARLAVFPDLPGKVGFALDCGAVPLLRDDPADFRVEQSETGLILRADGAPGGWPVTEETCISQLCDMAEWFAARVAPGLRRMSTVLAYHALPPEWTAVPPLPAAPRPQPGVTAAGQMLGAAFGQIESTDLRRLLSNSDCVAIRLTPWRGFILENATASVTTGFIHSPDDPLLRVAACPGAPQCGSSSVETRDLARALAGRVDGVLHVSGCLKGCAMNAAAEVTLVGRNGRFDLVRWGRAGDTPETTGLSPDDILAGGL